MARERHRPASSEEDDEGTEPDEPEEEGPRPGRRRGHRSDRAGGPGGITPWKDAASDDDAEEEPRASRGRRHGHAKEDREPVYFRARDSIWFEPLVALMIIVLLLVGLYAYTSNWPPMYVVESQSMQHGYDDQLGLINTGDLVLAQKIDPGSVVPYVVGLQTGYQTYGEYGDVLLYHPNGNTAVAPIIHRVILYLQYNPADDSYNAPELNGLSCGNGHSFVFTNSGSANGCGTTHLTNPIVLHHVGWQSVDVSISMDSGTLGPQSGFVTMGDNNFASGNGGQGFPDQEAQISTLVEPGWIVGVARGMVPWFGAVKLALDGNAGEVPTQSWQYLGITLVGLFLAALGLHLFLRAEGVEDPRRKAAEDAAAESEEAGDEGPPPEEVKPGGLARLRTWFRRGRHRDDPEERSADRAAPRGHRERDRGPSVRGRPKPHVGRRSVREDDSEDED